ncbi:MAG: hypothetical protein ABSF35_19820 [Polyangia bacterium]
MAVGVAAWSAVDVGVVSQGSVVGVAGMVRTSQPDTENMVR